MVFSLLLNAQISTKTQGNQNSTYQLTDSREDEDSIHNYRPNNLWYIRLDYILFTNLNKLKEINF